MREHLARRWNQTEAWRMFQRRVAPSEVLHYVQEEPVLWPRSNEDQRNGVRVSGWEADYRTLHVDWQLRVQTFEDVSVCSRL